MGDESRTALGSAHERFVRGLPERGEELRALCAQLAATPSDGRLLEQVRKRMHALFASAQVFEEEALSEAIERALTGLDMARDGGAPLPEAEIALLLDRCATLGATLFATSDGAVESARSRERVSTWPMNARWSGPPPSERAASAEAGIRDLCLLDW
jgi:chemotaxis protein histidine kinase CheA